MPCDFPLRAYRSATERGPSGKPLLTFNGLKSIQSTHAMEIPCNNCMGCKLEKARQWSVRMMHESKFWPQNSFITLTYDDQNVPQDFGLDLRHLQLFFKRLRKRLDQRIRFFACGEYGDENGRPHYHAVVFNYDPPDKLKHSVNEHGDINYSSEALSGLWTHGFATTADVTHASCSYVARYVTKKIKSGDRFGAERYYRLSPVDGAFHSVRPEFAVMSRRPGIGDEYVKQFKSDFYPSGFIVVNGVKQAPPKYYLSKLTEEERHTLQLKNIARNATRRPEKTMERRLAKAAVRDNRIKNLKRKL
ncbi:replication initiator protein [robinz microvirus RP_62]|nr:replication initiator protein [robinz microvirus RP_62]